MITSLVQNPNDPTQRRSDCFVNSSQTGGIGRLVLQMEADVGLSPDCFLKMRTESLKFISEAHLKTTSQQLHSSGYEEAS